MVGRASGVALPSDFARDRLEFADTTPRGFKASLLHDLERGSFASSWTGSPARWWSLAVA
jgi:hypothetical protein